MGDEPIILNIIGKAEPAGSKRSFVPTGKDGQPYRSRKNGRIVVNTVDDNPKGKGWQQSVEAQAREQYEGPVLTGACIVEMVFHVPRPKAHYGTGRNAEVLKDSAPAKPNKRPDALKLARGVEDALTGVIWTDDALTCDLIARKRYVGRDEVARVEVRVMLDPIQSVGDLVAAGLAEPPRPAKVEDDGQLSLLDALAPDTLVAAA